MRRTKKASQKSRQVAKEAQDTATKIDRLYQDAATTGLKAMTSQSVGEFNDGFRHIAEEMNTYSVRSLEQVVHAWSSFSRRDRFGRFSKFKRGMPKMRRTHTRLTSAKSLDLGEMYLDVTRRVSKPLAQERKRTR